MKSAVILTIILKSLQLFIGLDAQIESLPGKAKKAILMYVCGVIGLEKNANSSKISELLGGISHDKLTRALKGENVITGSLGLSLLNFCLSQTTGGWLIIDDFLLAKRYSSKIEGVYNEYDHVTRQRVKGMRIVMILWTNGTIRMPVAWSIWHKEDKRFLGYGANGRPKYQKTGYCLLKVNGQAVSYRTKNQIALSLLNDVMATGLNPKYITFDNWYANQRNLKRVHWLYLSFYSRLKENRKVIYQGEKISAKDLASRFPISMFDHKHNAYIKALPVYLPGFGEIKLLLVRKDRHQEPGRTKFLFTNNLNASAPEILLRYRSRWIIETAFRDLKQNLNFASCQARGLLLQENHLALCLLAFVSLELQPGWNWMDYQARTIGEKKLLLSSLSFVNIRDQFFLLESQKSHARLIPLASSDFAQVKDCVNRAFEILKN